MPSLRLSYVRERNKGRGSDKWTWAIEMNQPHDTYLSMEPHNRKKHRRGSNECSVVKCSDNIKRVAYEHYEEEKKPRRGKKSRSCSGNLELLREHINSMKKSHKSTCKMCGETTYMKCMLCYEHLCLISSKNITSSSCIMLNRFSQR
jgi:hypothetical protein